MASIRAASVLKRAGKVLAAAAFLAIPLVLSTQMAGPATDGGPEPVGVGSSPALAATIPGCSGTGIDEDIAITGDFGPELQGSYVMVPFQVPPGTDAVRVKYCHDQPVSPDPAGVNRHTIDMGIYQARSDPSAVWGELEFRGWGGSSRKDVTISPEGTFDPDPNPVATQKTTVGYRPGPVPAGEWAVELGVAAVATELSTEDGEVSWRVEIDLIDDPAFADEPYQPAPYDTAPADPDPGWYAGDFHVHARHSAPGDATMRETFDYAFGALPPSNGAGLDFITLSDYVTDRHWGEIGDFQGDYPGRLIVRSAEVITYRGHVNNHASYDFADYRTGPIVEGTLSAPGPGGEQTLQSTAEKRAARPASAIFDAIHAAGGWTQINHPETFPSEVPTFSNLCRGCSWEYSDAETDYSKVDAIEVATGPAGLQEGPEPGPNPFTPLAIQFYEDGIDAGPAAPNKIAAVGSSDSHNAGSPDDPLTQSPIGQATTVVQANQLSEKAIQAGVEAGHSFVKLWGNDGPDVRFCAGALGGDGQCSLAPDPAETIMGDTLGATSTTFSTRVIGAGPGATRPGLYTLVVVKDGLPILEIPITSDDFSFSFPSFGEGRYRLQVMRLATGVASIENVSSPIYLEPPGGGPPPDDDADDDGVPDDQDSCPLTPNPGQEDLDSDGLGDACDADIDGDGIANGVDSCPTVHGEGSADGCPAAATTPPPPPPAATAACTNALVGTPGRDRLLGTAGSDLIRGLRGKDRIRGRAGDDCLYGGGGGDKLRGGPGADLLSGGSGPDRINARDGEADQVRCGRGRDLALLDDLDRVLGGCERVRRR